MKKVLYISGIISVLLLALLLTGMADADNAVNNALREGNEHYALTEYTEALKSYEVGLTVSPDSRPLNFNSAQTAYLLGEYEKAIECYEKSEDSLERFLNAGNACFMLGEAGTDINQTIQYYSQAMQTYYDGIIKYPQNVPLKYNYETVKKKLEELMQNSETQDQNGQGQDESGEEQEQNGQEQDESGEEQEQNGQGQDESGEQQEQNGQGQDESGEEQEQNAQGQDESGEEQEKNGQGQDESGEEQEAQENAQDSQDGGQLELDEEAILRILQMLESQEEESLKNNQDVVGGKEGEYDW